MKPRGGDHRLMEQIGRYKVVSELGRGAMGVVYRAQDTRIGRELAVKVIRLPEHGSGSEVEQLRARLFREAQSAGRLSHRGIVTIYDVDETDDVAYIAMEYVSGRTLLDLLRHDVIESVITVPDMLRQLSAGLDYAHSRGVVHRDIKPANIMISDSGAVKIMDFGIARLSSSTLTQTGAALGTPRYMSPEQVKGEPVDGRSDQFSFAVMVYEILTGRPPFEGEMPTTVALKIVTSDPPVPSSLRSSVGKETDAVLMRALSKDPDKRFHTCGEFAGELANALEAQQETAEKDEEQSEAATTIMSSLPAAGHDAETVVGLPSDETEIFVADPSKTGVVALPPVPPAPPPAPVEKAAPRVAARIRA